MKCEWHRVKLGDIIRIKHGWAFPGDGIIEDDNSQVLVTPGNFNIGGGFKESNKKFYRGEYPKEYKFHGGEIIVTMTDLSKTSDTLGYSARVPCSSSRCYLHNQRIGLVQFANANVDEGFIYWLLRSRDYHERIVATASGTTVKHTSPSRIAAYEFSLPPLPTQRSIAAVLGALDDKIELNRKMNANLEAQAQALFKSWFVDFAPWGGKMPAGWKKGKLGEIAEVNPLRSIKKGTVAPCVEMADLSTSGAYPDAINLKQYAGGTKFRNGDTIMARITPCLENGKAGFVSFLNDDEIGFGSTEYIVIASKSAAPSELFYSLVRNPDFVRYATKHMVGSSGRQRVSWQEIAEYELPIATDDFYESISPRLKLFMEKMTANAKESRKLAELRDALLPKLMSGELEVAG